MSEVSDWHGDAGDSGSGLSGDELGRGSSPIDADMAADRMSFLGELGPSSSEREGKGRLFLGLLGLCGRP